MLRVQRRVSGGARGKEGEALVPSQLQAIALEGDERVAYGGGGGLRVCRRTRRDCEEEKAVRSTPPSPLVVSRAVDRALQGFPKPLRARTDSATSRWLSSRPLKKACSLSSRTRSTPHLLRQISPLRSRRLRLDEKVSSSSAAVEASGLHLRAIEGPTSSSAKER